MSVIMESVDGEHLLVCKGAVEETLAISAFIRDGEKLVPLDDAKRRATGHLTQGARPGL
jgi:Mg2+-importing ATPase